MYFSLGDRKVLTGVLISTFIPLQTLLLFCSCVGAACVPTDNDRLNNYFQQDDGQYT